MKLLYVSAVMAVFAAAAPGAVASSSRGVDTYDSEPSSSFDEYPQDSTFSADEMMDSEDEDSTFSFDEMMDSEDEPVNNNNMFVAIANVNNRNCNGIGPNTCDRRTACRWTCSTRRSSDRDRGCCQSRRSPSSPSRPRPTRNPTRRPSSSSSGGSSFQDGLRTGRNTAERIWRDMGNSCANAWADFQNRVNRRISDKGWNPNSGNWRTRAFSRGARDGMNEIVAQKEKECFHDNSDECVDLGDESARIIAHNHCSKFRYSSSISKRWRRECRSAAIEQCKSQIRNKVRNQCGSSPSTPDLTTLRNKCRNEVLTLIGDRSEEE